MSNNWLCIQTGQKRHQKNLQILHFYLYFNGAISCSLGYCSFGSWQEIASSVWGCDATWTQRDTLSLLTMIFIKTQIIIDTTALVQFGPNSPTSTAYAHKHKLAENGRAFMIQWLELANFQFLTVARMRDGHFRTRGAGSCQQIWHLASGSTQSDTEVHCVKANYAKYSTYVHRSYPAVAALLRWPHLDQVHTFSWGCEFKWKRCLVVIIYSLSDFIQDKTCMTIIFLASRTIDLYSQHSVHVEEK